MDQVDSKPRSIKRTEDILNARSSQGRCNAHGHECINQHFMKVSLQKMRGDTVRNIPTTHLMH